jgi:glycosyltransferase involved in cell wall biosynthesis
MLYRAGSAAVAPSSEPVPLRIRPWSAMAEVLMAVLQPDAGVFSVPSKMVSYLCAGRALLLAVPKENLAARIVSKQEAGLLVAPDDLQGFAAAAERLLSDAVLRERCGQNARAYADTHFQIDGIADKFQALLQLTAENPRNRPPKDRNSLATEHFQ